jgi:hypothetical protein
MQRDDANRHPIFVSLVRGCPAHGDRFHLFACFRHGLFPRHAWCLEKSPSAHPLLAHLYAGDSSRTQYPTGDGEVDTWLRHRLAIVATPQSHLLERPSACQLDGSGPHRHAATAKQPHPLSHWRWQPGRQTRGQESGGSEGPKKQVSPQYCSAPLLRAPNES